MTKDHLTLVAFFLLALIGVIAVNNVVLTDRIANKVIDKLKREYVPGPYQPGFDPDKVPSAPK
jgi:hypothetical protein